MMNLRLDIEYDGTGFAGWAKQPGLPSIGEELERALGRILQEEVRLSVAGRTDAGVHARGQVASLEAAVPVEPGRLLASANQLLPPQIVIKDVREAPPGFDARRSARSRTYSYSVLNRRFPSAFRHRFLHFHYGELDQGLLDRAAALIGGRHDFTAFTPTVSEHAHFERDITLSEWTRQGDILVYRIQASSFLRNMVRVLVGTMLEAGRSYRSLESLEKLLEGAAARVDAGVTAPPCGLCLEEVEY